MLFILFSKQKFTVQGDRLWQGYTVEALQGTGTQSSEKLNCSVLYKMSEISLLYCLPSKCPSFHRTVPVFALNLGVPQTHHMSLVRLLEHPLCIHPLRVKCQTSDQHGAHAGEWRSLLSLTFSSRVIHRGVSLLPQKPACNEWLTADCAGCSD